MCEPVSISMAVMAAVSTAMQVVSANQQANAENKAQSAYFKKTAENANQAAAYDMNAVVQRQGQEAEATAKDIHHAELQSRAAKATAKTAAAEGGVTGLGIDAMLADYDRSFLDYKTTGLANLEMSNVQAQNEMKAIQNQAQGRTNAATPQYRPTTGGIGAALQIGMSAGQGYLGGSDANFGGLFDKPAGNPSLRAVGARQSKLNMKRFRRP